ncbi:MAG: hypothetical protein OEW39_00005, partial [Deltaproteobacteria bacterium]|nr:hypothetical protein [Deltaproteobacteria bacterium]
MVTAGSALLIIGILLFAGATLIAGRKSVITDNLKDLKRTSEILAENAQRLLFSADLQAASVEEQILNLGVKNPEDFRRMIRTESMHKDLLSKLLALPDIDAMTIIDDKGDILASSRIWPPPKANVADRDYFQFLRDSPGGMVKIESVESNRVTGRGSILLVHRVTSPTDLFLGVVVATLAKNRFEKLFSTVLPSSRSAIAMYTLDGTRLVQESKF